jgi:hypothetical protein
MQSLPHGIWGGRSGNRTGNKLVFNAPQCALVLDA